MSNDDYLKDAIEICVDCGGGIFENEEICKCIDCGKPLCIDCYNTGNQCIDCI